MRAQTRIPKPFAVLAAVAILLGGAGLVTAASISGGETIAGLGRGDPFYHERGLSQRTVTLAVIVRAVDADGDEPVPVEGALVRLDHRITDKRVDFAAQLTDEDGRAMFELHRGRYMMHVQSGDAEGRHAFGLRTDQRIGVLIDEEGQMHFHDQARRDMRAEGRAYPLLVRVGQFDGETRAPVEGARVLVERFDRATGELEPFARNATDERGAATFQLPRGAYRVTVTTPEGHEASFRVQMDGPKAYGVMFDEDGNARIHEGRPHRDGADRPTRPKHEAYKSNT